MPNKQHPDFEAMVELGQELARDSKEAEKAPGVPFGMEKATARDWRKIVKENEEFRKTQLEEMGVKEFIKRWRGKSK